MSYCLTILGCSSALPTVHKNPTSQILHANNQYFLIDCAEGTQVQCRKYKLKIQKISRIFISHLHGDHYFGLIGLITSMHLLGRTKDLHIYAHQPLKEIINLQLRSANIELCFPLFFHFLPSDQEIILFENQTVKVSNILLDHRIECSGFLFEEKLAPRKIRSDRVKEYNIPFDSFLSLKNGKDFFLDDGSVIKNEFLTVENRPPFSYAYCSDTRYSEKIINKIKGVSLLYHEATYMHDRKDLAVKYFHSTSVDAANIAKKSHVKNLLIGHYSQRYRCLDDLLEESKSVFERTILSRDGLQINFLDL